MTTPRWNDELATGDPEVDREHQELFALVDELKDAASAGNAKARVGHYLDRFREHIAGHFPHEEAAMEAAGYPALGRHRESHARIADALGRMLVELQDGQAVLFADVAAFGNLLYRHVLLEDKGYADHQRKRT
jgi:hemerythrin-like metal-binding protein